MQEQAADITVIFTCRRNSARIPTTSDLNVDLFGAFEILLPTDLLQTLPLNLIGEGFEAEFGAAGRQRLDDSATSKEHVVNAEIPGGNKSVWVPTVSIEVESYEMNFTV